MASTAAFMLPTLSPRCWSWAPRSGSARPGGRSCGWPAATTGRSSVWRDVTIATPPRRCAARNCSWPEPPRPSLRRTSGGRPTSRAARSATVTGRWASWPGCWRCPPVRSWRSRVRARRRTCSCRLCATPCATWTWRDGSSTSTCSSWARRDGSRRPAETGRRGLMEIDVFTLFPEAFDWFASQRHVANALALGHELHRVNYRDHTPLSGRQVDDTPFGGGAGMVLRVDVVEAALRARYALDPVELPGVR